MRIRKKARKWVLNLWTVALAVLSATGLNPFESMDSPVIEAPIVREIDAWIEVEPGPEGQCIQHSRASGGRHALIWSRPS